MDSSSLKAVVFELFFLNFVCVQTNMMKLKTIVKVAEVNNLSDARYCAGMGVDFMGFVMKHKTKQIITKENYLAITGWLEGVKFVGEFWGATDEEIIVMQEACDFSFVQSDSIEQCERLSKRGIKTMFFTEEYPLIAFPFVSFVIVEGLSLDLGRGLQVACSLNQILLGGNISESQVMGLLEEEVRGIQLKGGDEIRPGYKDFDELASILEILEEE